MTNGFGKRLVVRLLLTILLTFTVLGTLGSGYAGYLLSSPKVCLSQVEKQQAAAKIHDSVESYFTAQYQTTAIPAETYLNVVTEDWIAERLEEQITSEYQILNGAKLSYQLDMSDLEAALTQFFSDYAEEINYTKDSTYEQKLQETIDNGEKIISDATDLLRTETLQKSGYLSKLHKLRTLTFAGEGVCGVLTVLLLLLLRNRYWIGTGCFGAGALLTAGAGVIFGTGVIHRFVLKEAAVYAVVTGTMTALTTAVLVSGIVLLALGVVLLALHLKGQRSEKAE